MIYKLSTIIKNKNIKKTYNNKLSLKENIINFYNFIKKENKNIKKLEINVNKENYKFIKTKTLYIIKKINLKGGEIQKENIDDFIKKTNSMSSYDINSKLEYIEGKDDVIDETNIDYLIELDENLIYINLNDDIYNHIYSLYTFLYQTIENINKDLVFKQKLVDIYNKNKNEDKDVISIETFDFFKHFNYSLAVKKIEDDEIKKFIIKIDKIRKLYLGILYKIIDDLICEVKKDKKCYLDNVGSEGISSDYDISFNKVNYDNIIYSEFINIINSYNKIYNDNFFINNILDINFYQCEYDEVDEEDIICSLEQCRTIKNIEKTTDFYEKQLRWSNERIKENNSNIKIDDYNEDIIEELKILKINFNKLIPFCDDDNYDNYIKEYNDKLIELINKSLDLLKSINKDDDKDNSNIELLYENISEIRFMSNDAYYTSGAYIHIIGILQKYLNSVNADNVYNIINKFDKNLLIIFYIMSFNENLGYLLEKIKHNNSENDVLTVKYKEIKYIYRCFNAITMIISLKRNEKDIFVIDVDLEKIQLLNHENDRKLLYDIMKYISHYIYYNIIFKSKNINKNEDTKEKEKIENFKTYFLAFRDQDYKQNIKIGTIKDILIKIYNNLINIDKIDVMVIQPIKFKRQDSTLRRTKTFIDKKGDIGSTILEDLSITENSSTTGGKSKIRKNLKKQ
jgi:hypothetical protein